MARGSTGNRPGNNGRTLGGNGKYKLPGGGSSRPPAPNNGRSSGTGGGGRAPKIKGGDRSGAAKGLRPNYHSGGC